MLRFTMELRALREASEVLGAASTPNTVERPSRRVEAGTMATVRWRALRLERKELGGQSMAGERLALAL